MEKNSSFCFHLKIGLCFLNKQGIAMIRPAVSQCLKPMCFPGTQIEFLTGVILENMSMLTAAPEVEEATHAITHSSLSCGVCHIELMPGVFTAGNIAQ